MKILILNIRDINHPQSGGAEVFTHEVSKRLCKFGHKVTIFCSSYKNCKKYENIDGINIIRMGNYYNVVYLFKLYYEKYFKNDYDLIIDEYTLMPFLTPTYVKMPIYFLVHELAREKYFYIFPPLISHVFYFCIEPFWIRKYKEIPTLTVSNSTKKDLEFFGLNNISILPEGINFTPINDLAKKELEPTFIFVGLLNKLNLVDHVIEAFKKIKNEIPQAKLWIVGRGPLLKKLIKKSKNLPVTFFGYVTDEKKLNLMKRAHVLLFPGIREGWGLVVTEANANGTPAIGYNVPGLRDSINNNYTGFVVDPNPEALAKKAISLMKDTNLLKKISYNALNSSKQYNWENTAIFLDKLISSKLS